MKTAASFALALPTVNFVFKEPQDANPGYHLVTRSSSELFGGRRIACFCLPGAFTPTCSSTHLPGFEAYYDDIKNYVDEVFCLSVNDGFVMDSWFKQLDIQKVKPVPDGAGKFTRQMGMLVDKDNIGFGMRSWRYSFVADSGIVEQMWVERGYGDNTEGDPFQVSDAATMLKWLESSNKAS